MFSSSLRMALRTRTAAVPRLAPAHVVMMRVAVPQIRAYSNGHEHHEETFEEFTARYVPICSLIRIWTQHELISNFLAKYTHHLTFTPMTPCDMLSDELDENEMSSITNRCLDYLTINQDNHHSLITWEAAYRNQKHTPERPQPFIHRAPHQVAAWQLIVFGNTFLVLLQHSRK